MFGTNIYRIPVYSIAKDTLISEKRKIENIGWGLVEKGPFHPATDAISNFSFTEIEQTPQGDILGYSEQALQEDKQVLAVFKTDFTPENIADEQVRKDYVDEYFQSGVIKERQEAIATERRLKEMENGNTK